MTLDNFTWDMGSYISKHSLPAELTQKDVERIFQLAPEPPNPDDLNSFIVGAIQKRDLKYFSCTTMSID